MLMQTTLEGNDCAGTFGIPFASCTVQDADGNSVSPIIVKYDYENGSTTEINSALYPSFTGDEISINLEDQSWTYDRGENDPGIRFWTAKGGPDFNLFWYVEEDTVGDACDSIYSLACLQQALVVEGSTWSTPINPANDQPYGLSHLAFYNTDMTVSVPEPGTAALLLSGLMGLIMARRRQNKLQA